MEDRSDVATIQKKRQVCKEVEKVVSSGSTNQNGYGSELDLYGDYGDDIPIDLSAYGSEDISDLGFRRRLQNNCDSKELFDPLNYDTSLTLEDRIDVSIWSRKPLDEETENELQQFNWKI